MDAGAKERLVRVDVAQTRHNRLIEQRGFDGAAASRQPRGQRLHSEAGIQRLRAERGEERRQLLRAGQRQPPKLARIGIQQAPVVVQHDGDAHVGLVFVGRGQAQIARHAAVHEQDRAVIQIDQQVFAAPANRGDDTPGQASFELRHG